MTGKKSAGLLLFRHTAQGIEVLLVHPGGPFWTKKDDGAWSIPKGEFTDCEEPLAAAKREFEEEMGIAVEGEFIALDTLKQPGGKLVFAWAVRADFDPAVLNSNTFSIEWPPRSGKQQTFPEVDKAAWFGIDAARTKILKGQAEFLDRLMAAFPQCLFEDRRDAGRRLAARLLAYRDNPQVTVLALPRGGVPVGYEVAQALRVPLDIFLVRKLGAPGHEELAMGAIATGGIRVLNLEVVRALHISEPDIEAAVANETLELHRREREYRGALPALALAGRIVILIDDGLATGSSMRAAIEALRLQDVATIVAAIPVAPPQTFAAIESQVDELICLEVPDTFESVGEWYEDFSQTSDAEVRHLLHRANRKSPIVASN